MAGPLASCSFLLAGEGAALASAGRLLGLLGANFDTDDDRITGAITDDVWREFACR